MEGWARRLVLNRKRGQRIVIPSCLVTITVVTVEGGRRARIGIDAPAAAAEVAVLREELAQRKQMRQGGGHKPR
jgi:sRNA-binding carbon storage regulator CsrA